MKKPMVIILVFCLVINHVFAMPIPSEPCNNLPEAETHFHGGGFNPWWWIGIFVCVTIVVISMRNVRDASADDDDDW